MAASLAAFDAAQARSRAVVDSLLAQLQAATSTIATLKAENKALKSQNTRVRSIPRKPDPGPAQHA